MTSITDSIDAISTAAALVMEISAPTGTIVYGYIQYVFDEEEIFENLYTSEEAVYAAMRNWIIYTWKNNTLTPWNESGQTMEQWLENKKDKDIVDAYYNQYPGESYRIFKYRIVGMPESII